ncbi:MAG: exonuclease domain-containing protein [Peptostreptococcus sp.]|uniref:exonuclease domain-containing protein n=1 Tax=Peptostreptococcus sp. TaxID=1262 RepID=UPI002FC74A8A
MTTTKNKYSTCTYFPKEYVVLDLEATGTSEFNYIIELSAFKVSNGKIIDEYSTLVKPPRYRLFSKRRRKVQSFCEKNGKKIYYIDKFIENLTGIDNKMISSAKNEADVIKEFYQFIGESVLIGHGMGNDLTIINKSFNRVLKKELTNYYLDTFVIALFLDDKEYSLVNLCNRFGIENQDIHRAKSDAYRTYLCYEALIKELKQKYPNSANEDFLTWNTIRQEKQTKILKNKVMRSLNKKRWSDLKKYMFSHGNCEEILSGASIVISNKISEKDQAHIKEQLELVDAHISNRLGIKTDYYIADKKEFSINNINLEDKKLRKIINMNKKGSRIRIFNSDEIIKIFEKEYDPSYIYEGEHFKKIQFSDQRFYIYNDFLSITNDELYEIIKSRGGIISDKLDSKVNWILSGENRDKDIFNDSYENEVFLSLLAFGCNISVSNESFFMKTIDDDTEDN